MAVAAYAPVETTPHRENPESHMRSISSEEAIAFPQTQADGSFESQE